ncbi:MAG: family 16 glycoside hydrolase, partial [Chloroflexota bacterium]
MSIIHGIIILSMIVTMIVPTVALTNIVNAQDATQDVSVPSETPTDTPVVATDAPTETPAPATDTPAPAQEVTPEVTTVVTDEATAVPTEAATEATVEPTSTSDVTEEPTMTPTETPVSTLLFQDDFQDGSLDGWSLTPGWQIVTDGDNLFLSTGTPSEAAAITAVAPADFVFTARVQIATGNKATLAFRSGAETYALTLDMNTNTATVLKNSDSLGEITLIPAAADENGQIPSVWHTVTITADGNTISVNVDGLPVGSTFVDPNPLPAGAIILSTDAANTGMVAIDDVVINAVEPVAVTETPTAVPTEETTPELTPEATPTLEPTEESTPETTPEAAGQVILNADFEGELQGWSALTEGASIVAEGDANHALLLAPTANFLPSEPIYLADFTLDMRLNIASDAQDGTSSGISIPFRTQDGKTYVLSVEAGQTVLYRNDGEGLLPLATSPTAHALNTWHSLNLDAKGGALVVTIDDTAEINVTENDPLASGQIAFVANAASSVLVDDIVVTDFSGALAMSATPEPMGLSEEALAKLPAGLVDVVTMFVSGDTAGAQALAKDNFIPMDEQGLIQVVIWANTGETGASLSAIVQTIGGVADYVYDDNVHARVPLAGFVALLNAPQINAIKLASLATSTGLPGAPTGSVTPGGTVVGEGFDIIAANDWLSAATEVAGAGQNIALIDTGFVGVSAGGEYGCWNTLTANPSASLPNDSKHGAQVLQILCDVAPKAKVRLYRALDAAGIKTAIDQIMPLGGSNSISVILITEDLGVDQGPGDGIGTGSPSAVAYTGINTATLAGKLVIASAGNNNWWLSDSSCIYEILGPTCVVLGDPYPDNHRIGRYFSVSYPLGSATINIPVKIK